MKLVHLSSLDSISRGGLEMLRGGTFLLSLIFVVLPRTLHLPLLPPSLGRMSLDVLPVNVSSRSMWTTLSQLRTVQTGLTAFLEIILET